MIARRLLLGGISLLLCTFGIGFASPASALPFDTAVNRFGGCLAAQKSGAVLLMIDESGSLQETDPDANRVTAAKYLVEQLADFSSGSGIAINVSIAGFSDGFDQQLGWTKLDGSSLPTVESSIDGFRGRNTGQDTDYWLALDGARKLLADAPKPAEGRRCQALAWFTDGKLDFTQRDLEKPYAPGTNLNSTDGVEATVKAAQDSICRDRGLADQLRSSDIVTFGIGLAPKPEQTADFDLLKAIVTGEPSGAVSSCGAVRSPDPGDFYLAQNIDDLLFAFDAFSTPGQPPIETSTGACAKAICEEAKHRFVLDRSVRSVSVLAAADRPGLVPYLVAPDGSSLSLGGAAAVGDLDGVSVDHRPQTNKSVSFKMSNSQAPQWQGVWALVFVDPTGDATAKTRSSIHIAGDLYPGWPDAGKTTLHSGDATVPVSLTIVDSKQQPFDPSNLLGQAALSAVLVDVTGAEHPLALELLKDQISTPQTMDLSGVPPGAATLHLDLDVTTADARDAGGTVVPGTKLAPQSVDLPLNIDPPVGYPKVGERIDFGSVEGAGTFAGSLAVTGPGCAWLPGDLKADVAAAPDGIGEIAVQSSANSSGNCVKAAEGQQQSLPVELKVPQAGTGTVNGSVKVMVGPADGSAEPVAVEVPFSASLAKPLDADTFWATVIAALVLGPGIPALLFYLSKWWVSRIPNRGLKVEKIPVQVEGGSVYRDGGPFGIRPGELVNLVPGLDKPVRRLDIGGITLHTRIGWSPFGGGFVVASAQGRAGAAGPGGATHGKTPDAKLPLAVHNQWFVTVDPAGPVDAATVVLLVAAGSDDTVVNRLVNEVSASLPQFFGDLRKRATPPTNGVPPTPSPAVTPAPGGPFDTYSPGPFDSPAPPSSEPYGSGSSSGQPTDPTNPFS